MATTASLPPGAESDQDFASKEPHQMASIDIEARGAAEAHLKNTTVQNISWKGMTVTVKDRDSKQPKRLIDGLEGVVYAGMIRSFLLFYKKKNPRTPKNVEETTKG
jgi:hypothetical protein